MVVSTAPYTQEESKRILNVRCKEEDAELSIGALESLTRIGMEISLRYTMHMIIAASFATEKRECAEVIIEDITRVYSLYADVNIIYYVLMEYQNELCSMSR